MTAQTFSYLKNTLYAANQGAGAINPGREGDVPDTMAATSWVSVKQYGATGNGSTDDTTAITNAIASGAGIIWVPDGTYITSGNTLNNAGQAMWISPGATLKQKAATSNGQVLHITAANVTVTGGGVIDGNRANTTSCFGFWIDQVANVEVSNLRIQHISNAGVYGRDCNFVAVLNCYITDCGSNGIFVEALTTSRTLEGILYSGNTVDRSAEAAATISEGGIKAHGTNGPLLGVVIVNNFVRLPTSPTSGSCIGIEIENPNTLTTVANNYLTGGAEGISFDSTVDGTATGNQVTNASLIGMEMAACTRTTFTGNTVRSNGLTNNCMNINNFSSTNTQNALVGNTIEGGHSVPVNLYLVVSLSMIGNVILNEPGINNGAILLNGGGNLYISGGEISGNSAAGYTGVDIEAGSTNLSHVVIDGVYIHDMSNSAVTIGVTSPAVVDHVMITGCDFTTGIPTVINKTGTGSLGNNVAVMNCLGAVGTSTTNGNARRGSCLDWSNQVWDFIGSGSPASSVTAGPGSIYRNQAGGTSTTFYVKESGTGNSGWVAK